MKMQCAADPACPYPVAVVLDGRPYCARDAVFFAPDAAAIFAGRPLVETEPEPGEVQRSPQGGCLRCGTPITGWNRKLLCGRCSNLWRSNRSSSRRAMTIAEWLAWRQHRGLDHPPPAAAPGAAGEGEAETGAEPDERAEPRAGWSDPDPRPIVRCKRCGHPTAGLDNLCFTCRPMEIAELDRETEMLQQSRNFRRGAGPLHPPPPRHRPWGAAHAAVLLFREPEHLYLGSFTVYDRDPAELLAELRAQFQSKIIPHRRAL